MMMSCRIKRLIMSDSLSYLVYNRCRYSGQKGTDSEYSSSATNITQRKTAGIIGRHYEYFALRLIFKIFIDEAYIILYTIKEEILD